MLVATTENLPGYRVLELKARSSGWSFAAAAWRAM